VVAVTLAYDNRAEKDHGLLGAGDVAEHVAQEVHW
jgi:hypothetical protein